MSKLIRSLSSWLCAALAIALLPLAAAAQNTTVNLALGPLLLGDGRSGAPLTIESASPPSLEHIVARRIGAPVTLPAQWFKPSGPSPHPVVILVPGSGGVSEAHLLHARQILDAGVGVLLFDPFGPRQVASTVADQSSISFAASTYDVLAAMRLLALRTDVDVHRIAVLGYSRGGFAAHSAAMRPLADAVLGGTVTLRAAVAAWPYCGLQFARPEIGSTALHFALAERDDWVSPVQCQALAGALTARGARVSVRLFKGANHGFGYAIAPRTEPQAIKAFAAPVLYVADDGVLLNPYSARRMPGADERAMFGLLAPFITRGVTLGPRDGDNEAFMQDLLQFLKRELRAPAPLAARD